MRCKGRIIRQPSGLKEYNGFGLCITKYRAARNVQERRRARERHGASPDFCLIPNSSLCRRNLHTGSKQQNSQLKAGDRSTDISTMLICLLIGVRSSLLTNRNHSSFSRNRHLIRLQSNSTLHAINKESNKP